MSDKDKWDDKIINALKEIEKDDSVGFFNLISIAIHNKLTCTSSTNIDKLYNAIGYEAFTKVIQWMGGRKVVIPKEDEFKNMLMTVIIYYYREIKKYSWDEISAMFPYDNISKVYPKQVKAINDTIKKELVKIMEEKN